MKKFWIKSILSISVSGIIASILILILMPLIADNFETPLQLSQEEYLSELITVSFITLGLSILLSLIWIIHGATLSLKNFFTSSQLNHSLWWILFFLLICSIIAIKYIFTLASKADFFVLPFLILFSILNYCLSTYYGAFPAAKNIFVKNLKKK